VRLGRRKRGEGKDKIKTETWIWGIDQQGRPIFKSYVPEFRTCKQRTWTEIYTRAKKFKRGAGSGAKKNSHLFAKTWWGEARDLTMLIATHNPWTGCEKCLGRWGGEHVRTEKKLWGFLSCSTWEKDIA